MKVPDCLGLIAKWMIKSVKVHDYFKLHVRRIRNHTKLFKFCNVSVVSVSQQQATTE